MGEIRLAVAGVGNCCSSLVQGIQYYRNGGVNGLLHDEVGGYGVSDVKFVAAFDVDARKVGLDLSEAIFSEPNKVSHIVEMPKLDVEVQMGSLLDDLVSDSEGVVVVSDASPVDVAGALREARADILVNLVSGSALESSKFYAEVARDAGCGFINATPSPVVHEAGVADKFAGSGLPLVGDDLLDQIGATVVHIGLLEFLHGRGIHIDESYQLDVGGGAESVNTLWKTRELKRKIKTTAVSGAVPYEFPLVSGSTDYVDFLGNSRDSFFWFKGRYFGGAPFTMDAKLSTMDAHNAGAILLDVIRGVKLAKDRGQGGALQPLCAYGFKRPPERLPLIEAYKLFKEFVEA